MGRRHYLYLDNERWSYLAVIIDFHSRKPVSWVLSLSPNTELVNKAPTMA